MLTTRYHRLSKRQLAVITDMFENGLTKSHALQKNSVPRWVFRRWAHSHSFIHEYNSRIDEAAQQKALTIARVYPQAAKKLADLIASEKEETARKACLDLVTLRKADAAEDAAEREKNKNSDCGMTYEETAACWKVLAEMRTKARKEKEQNRNTLNQQNL